MKCLPCIRACVRVCVCMSAFVIFLINLYITFINEDIFTKFAENVYGCENFSVTNFVHILKNKVDAIADCLKIIDIF